MNFNNVVEHTNRRFNSFRKLDNDFEPNRISTRQFEQIPQIVNCEDFSNGSIISVNSEEPSQVISEMRTPRVATDWNRIDLGVLNTSAGIPLNDYTVERQVRLRFPAPRTPRAAIDQIDLGLLNASADISLNDNAVERQVRLRFPAPRTPRAATDQIDLGLLNASADISLNDNAVERQVRLRFPAQRTPRAATDQIDLGLLNASADISLNDNAVERQVRLRFPAPRTPRAATDQIDLGLLNASADISLNDSSVRNHKTLPTFHASDQSGKSHIFEDTMRLVRQNRRKKENDKRSNSTSTTQQNATGKDNIRLERDCLNWQSRSQPSNTVADNWVNMSSRRITLPNYASGVVNLTKLDLLNGEPFSRYNYTTRDRQHDAQMPGIVLPTPADIATFSSKTVSSDWLAVQNNWKRINYSPNGILLPSNQLVHFPVPGLYEKTALYHQLQYPYLPVYGRNLRRRRKSNKQLIGIFKIVGNILCPGLGTVITLGQIALGQKSIFSLFGSIIGAELFEELFNGFELLDFVGESADFSDVASTDNHLGSCLLDTDPLEDIFPVEPLFSKFHFNEGNVGFSLGHSHVDTTEVQSSYMPKIFGCDSLDSSQCCFVDTSYVSHYGTKWNVSEHANVEKFVGILPPKPSTGLSLYSGFRSTTEQIYDSVDDDIILAIDKQGIFAGATESHELGLDMSAFARSVSSMNTVEIGYAGKRLREHAEILAEHIALGDDHILPIGMAPHHYSHSINAFPKSTIGNVEIKQLTTDQELPELPGLLQSDYIHSNTFGTEPEHKLWINDSEGVVGLMPANSIYLKQSQITLQDNSDFSHVLLGNAKTRYESSNARNRNLFQQWNSQEEDVTPVFMDNKRYYQNISYP